MSLSGRRPGPLGEGEEGPSSICVDEGESETRPEARTQSITWCELTANEATMRYAARDWGDDPGGNDAHPGRRIERVIGRQHTRHGDADADAAFSLRRYRGSRSDQDERKRDGTNEKGERHKWWSVPVG